VQEEIRFAVCPELIASLYVCPEPQTNEEAIILLGAKQYAAFKGYMFSLRFDGHHDDHTPWYDSSFGMILFIHFLFNFFI
jgi:hypothetical protein